MRVMSNFHDEIFSDTNVPSGLNQVSNSELLLYSIFTQEHKPQQLDFREVTIRYNRQLQEYYEEWTRRFEEDSDLQGEFCPRNQRNMRKQAQIIGF